MRYSVILLLFMFIFAVSSEAAKHRVESWYFHVAFGAASPSYDKYNEAAIDLLEEAGASSLSVNFDFGFYWPLLDNKAIAGITYNGIGDRYSIDGNWIQLNQYLIGGSFKYFLMDNIGKGLYLRADAGLGMAGAITSTDETYSADSGFAFLIGAGWAIPISAETRINLFIDYSSRSLGNEEFNALTYNVGFMF